MIEYQMPEKHTGIGISVKKMTMYQKIMCLVEHILLNEIIRK